MTNKVKPFPYKKIRSLYYFPWLILLACRPVMTVGRVEIFILFALVIFLFGPPLFRLLTRWRNYRSEQHDKEKRKN